MTGGDNCDKVTVEVVVDVVGEVIGECDEDGTEVGVCGGGSPSPSNWEKVGWKPAFLSTVKMRRRFSSFGEGCRWSGRGGWGGERSGGPSAAL